VSKAVRNRKQIISKELVRPLGKSGQKPLFNINPEDDGILEDQQKMERSRTP
jgi:hypothetical protein